ncbi:hypothetical protein BD289DRAFT_264235 [Coniella lustricola]|uniref:Uncharacterized protein n=1 Tax=Coniella lustricola TaxID=2025994 RepID=A0A2T3A7E4_9PEZI|nr:hypothetical protein BD289DRAFT_264235 [Coniella lustricola]
MHHLAMTLVSLDNSKRDCPMFPPRFLTLSFSDTRTTHYVRVCLDGCRKTLHSPKHTHTHRHTTRHVASRNTRDWGQRRLISRHYTEQGTQGKAPIGEPPRINASVGPLRFALRCATRSSPRDVVPGPMCGLESRSACRMRIYGLFGLFGLLEVMLLPKLAQPYATRRC